MRLNFRIRDAQTVTIVEPVGELDSYTVLTLRRKLRALVIERECSKLAVNLSQVGFLNTTAVGALIGIHHLVCNRQGRITLCSASSAIRHVLYLVGADRVIPIYDTEEQALASF